ncbi:MAG: 3-phosphoserine/phosphohydroxythreonine transaminase [Deltaproteobacteria bacterium]|nr:3-phosphoserine/phosphohydroxythreonine transaminase [Deltaproteobacteria bacterium]
MSRIYNFNPGPSTLPLPVLERVADEFVDFQGAGMSIVEMSHRAKEYDGVHNKAMSLVKELYGLPDNYKVLLLGGGATLQFSMIPLNFLPEGKSCDFTVTGSWAKKAYEDAKKIGEVNVVYDGKPDSYLNLPKVDELKLDPKAAYLHMTSNETIGGVQWQSFPDAGRVPIICDMSSDFVSRKIPVEKFGMIYAGAQKNAGPAGVAIVILREDMLERCPEDLTAYLSYKTHWNTDSLYNTPPVFAIYMVKLTMEWLEEQGGLDAAEKMADERAGLIYGAIDEHGEFYRCPVPEHCRSKMNVVFRLPSEELEKKFVADAAAEGMIGLKGHRSVGGCRASIYNAMPIEGAKALADFMGEFAKKHG